MKKQLLLFVTLLLPMVAMADAVEINGIYYNLVPKTGEAEVTSHPSKYTGKVVIPEKVEKDGKEYSVTIIGGSAFNYCTGLTSVDIPNSVTSIGSSAFQKCYGLTSITFPNSLISIGDYAFDDCRGITTIIIPNSVTTIGNDAFFSCKGLTSLTIGNSVKTIGQSAFKSCPGLTSVIIPNSVTSIGRGAFTGCTGLTSVTIGKSVTTIGNDAFLSCSSLTSITIPNSVTTIGDEAFKNCKDLISVYIGSGIKTIFYNAFSNCPNIEHVYCYAEIVPSTKADAFDGSYPEATTLHVPEASLDAYKAAEPWSKFKPIVAISGSDPGAQKCATPTIKINGGEVTFECETEGVTFNAGYSYNSGSGNVVGNKMILAGATNCQVTVYATKEGYQDSDVATADVELQVGKRGDVNMDGSVTITDAVTVVNIILNGEE